MMDARTISLAVLISLAGACTRQQVSVSPTELFAARPRFATGQGVMLSGNDGATRPVRADQRVEIVDLRGEREWVTISSLLDRCAGPVPDCARTLHRVLLVDETHLSTGAKVVLGAGAVVGGLGGLIYCTAECGSPGNYASAAGLVVLVVLAVASSGIGALAMD